MCYYLFVKFPDKYQSASLKNGVVSICEIKFPNKEICDNSLVIKPLYIGICRADVKEVIGSRDIPEDRGPLFGHEFIGKIVHTGKYTGFKENDFVTFNPNITPNRTTGFAEYFFIEGDNETLNNAIVLIDESLTDPIWQPEPFACIVHSINKLLEHSGWQDFSNKKSAVIGCGNSGIMFGQNIKNLKGEVTMFNRGQMRRRFIVEQNLFDKEEVEPLKNVSNQKNNFDVVIVVPTKINSEVLEDSYELIKEGGFILLYGGTQKDDLFLDLDIKIDPIRRNETSEKVDYRDKKFYITGAYGCGKEDFEKGIKLYKEQNSNFPLQNLVSKEVQLSEFPELITKMSTGELDFPGKVVVKP